MAEKAILAEANHPFILRLVRTFHHPNVLYMLLELVQVSCAALSHVCSSVPAPCSSPIEAGR